MSQKPKLRSSFARRAASARASSGRSTSSRPPPKIHGAPSTSGTRSSITICRPFAQGQGRRLHQGAERSPARRRAGDLLRPRRRQAVPEEAERRGLYTIDATCPLVTKVHREAQVHHKRGRHVVLIGHVGHPEVVGTMGQLPEGAATLVSDAAEVEALAIPDGQSSPMSRRRRFRSTTRGTSSPR